MNDQVKAFNHKYPREAHSLFMNVAEMAEAHRWSKFPSWGARLNRSDLIMTLGSCFAENIGNTLKKVDLLSITKESTRRLIRPF